MFAYDRFKPGMTPEWFFIPLQVPLPIESLFRGEVDVAEPYDRTTTVSS